jgi:hypothetical protein
MPAKSIWYGSKTTHNQRVLGSSPSASTIFQYKLLFRRFDGGRVRAWVMDDFVRRIAILTSFCSSTQVAVTGYYADRGTSCCMKIQHFSCQGQTSA